jgi:hypothetical protein
MGLSGVMSVSLLSVEGVVKKGTTSLPLTRADA